MLGVAGQSDPAGCRIHARESGVGRGFGRVGNRRHCRAVQDQAVPDFDTLTLIGSKNPGDKVTIELLRGNETLKKEVEFGAWK